MEALCSARAVLTKEMFGHSAGKTRDTEQARQGCEAGMAQSHPGCHFCFSGPLQPPFNQLQTQI